MGALCPTHQTRGSSQRGMNNHALLGPLDLLAPYPRLSLLPSPRPGQHCEPVSLHDYSPGISVFSGYFWALFQPTQLRCLSRLLFGVSQSISRDLASSLLLDRVSWEAHPETLGHPVPRSPSPTSFSHWSLPRWMILNLQGNVSHLGLPWSVVNFIFPVHALGNPDSVSLARNLFLLLTVIDLAFREKYKMEIGLGPSSPEGLFLRISPDTHVVSVGSSLAWTRRYMG